MAKDTAPKKRRVASKKLVSVSAPVEPVAASQRAEAIPPDVEVRKDKEGWAVTLRHYRTVLIVAAVLLVGGSIWLVADHFKKAEKHDTPPMQFGGDNSVQIGRDNNGSVQVGVNQDYVDTSIKFEKLKEDLANSQKEWQKTVGHFEGKDPPEPLKYHFDFSKPTSTPTTRPNE